MNRRRFLAALGGFIAGCTVGSLLPKDDAPLTVKCAPADGPFDPRPALPTPTRAPVHIADTWIEFGPGLYRLELPDLPPGLHVVHFNHPRP